MTTPLHIVDQKPADRPDCRTVAELLPWLLNGTLDGREQAAVREHLAGCESCRHELEESALVWQMACDHVPSLDLAEFAQDLEPSGWDRGRIERHLALCPSCRQELEWATEGRVVDFQRVALQDSAVTPRPARWRRLAVAASFAAALVSGVSVWYLGGPGSSALPGVTTAARAAAPEADWPLSTGLQASQSESVRGDLFTDDFEAGSASAWSSLDQ